MLLPNDLEKRIQNAVKYFWLTRDKQLEQQAQSGKVDQGLRSAVTGGKQMDGFVELIKYLLKLNGIKPKQVT